MKLSLMLLALLILLPGYSSGEFTPDFSKEKSQNYRDFAECYYIFTKLNSGIESQSLKEKIEITYPKMISNYENFIKMRPDSFLIAEVKVFVAQLYMFSGVPFESDKLSPDFNKITFNINWKTKANPLLIDVIRDYPDNKLFSLVKTSATDEYSAAVAMWHLGIWNNNPYYLSRLVVEYPTSEFAGEAAKILKEAGLGNLIHNYRKSPKNRRRRTK